MFALTEDAADAIRQLTEAPTAEGVRISPAPVIPGDDTSPGLQIELVAAPDDGDAVLEADGAKLFIEPAIAPALDDKVLDAEAAGDEIRFAIFAQPAGGDQPNGGAPD